MIRITFEQYSNHENTKIHEGHEKENFKGLFRGSGSFVISWLQYCFE
jgi:hypothetical protein